MSDTHEVISAAVDPKRTAGEYVVSNENPDPWTVTRMELLIKTMNVNTKKAQKVIQVAPTKDPLVTEHSAHIAMLLHMSPNQTDFGIAGIAERPFTIVIEQISTITMEYNTNG